MEQVEISKAFNRRDFLKGGSLGSMVALLGAAGQPEVRAQDAGAAGPPVPIGLIGCGYYGRDILGALALLPNAPVAALCDTYGAFLRRAGRAEPQAAQYERYQDLLEDEKVQAVIVATPTHQHAAVVRDALAAGKHVYCEAPLAHTLEEASEIARMVLRHPRLYFQAGLQNRSDPQRDFLLDFIRTGAWGRTIQARAQWHRKTSWRRSAPTSQREREINWRLDKGLSAGLAGEIGIHQLDSVSRFFRQRPVGVQGYGSLIEWDDGREIPDTVQAMVEYPGGVRLSYGATLANSFDGEYEIYYGSSAALMVRGERAWMFREADAPLLGWEVYALKETFHKEIGVALSADATKLDTVTGGGLDQGEAGEYVDTPLHRALEAFVHNVHVHQAGVEDFIFSFGEDDPGMLGEYLADLGESKLAAADVRAGHEATVVALKVNEAVSAGSSLAFEDRWFEIG